MSTTNPQSDAQPDDVPRRARSRRTRPTEGTPAAAARSRRLSKARRRVANVAGLMAALVLTGALYSTLAPAHADEVGAAGDPDYDAGQEIYENSCISCHGSNLEGVDGRGPSLIGVGGAAVYFQVHTGRMPLVRQGEQAADKPVVFSDEEIDQLVTYVQANGGGPAVPSDEVASSDGDLALGGELFRLNCASCHNFVGEGGALSSGKYAPSLHNADDLEIYTAMLSGPENMPVFGDNQLSPEEKRAIINYIQTVKEMPDPGGAGIGRTGPVAEGLVIWLVGMSALMFGIFWMGSKA
ncbi:cytochrome bc1 complex diheme cytochrome c subunit [Trujillonella endophytica]|uniref:Cytochrome bc1 complex cytochrome c subunit n=1 Tax=Trujillonella endophytica TaxID=673521 RepID=A0A1H8VNL0_9ACTN|nr:c-type cytochrome [Trujillella endophytica]SEP16995.1 ubiquinol-cytochrome c reductase cytochrome c subunit [Trujillella endophytica]